MGADSGSFADSVGEILLLGELEKKAKVSGAIGSF